MTSRICSRHLLKTLGHEVRTLGAIRVGGEIPCGGWPSAARFLAVAGRRRRDGRRSDGGGSGSGRRLPRAGRGSVGEPPTPPPPPRRVAQAAPASSSPGLVAEAAASPFGRGAKAAGKSPVS
ncbi:hypothetical protein SETIT_6G249900v2 [Setaria italica]|uniref:Uncharacterized protein n=1 Tax=Setaria italica TaxID=4555 RepID=A0A368RQ73_SETIT|nr:hypothetical protein SETIT_6G249900v2 [Setaria italica]